MKKLNQDSEGLLSVSTEIFSRGRTEKDIKNLKPALGH